MRGEERQQHFTRGFFSSGQKSLWLWHCLSSIHCHEAIMSGLCNVCDYLSNCHGIVCQFCSSIERGKHRESGRETQMFIWRRYLNVRNKIRHGHNGKVTQTEWLECCGCLGDAIKAQLLFSPNLSRAQPRPKSVRIMLSPVFVWLTGEVGGGGWLLHKWEHSNWSPPQHLSLRWFLIIKHYLNLMKIYFLIQILKHKPRFLVKSCHPFHLQVSQTSL